MEIKFRSASSQMGCNGSSALWTAGSVLKLPKEYSVPRPGTSTPSKNRSTKLMTGHKAKANCWTLLSGKKCPHDNYSSLEIINFPDSYRARMLIMENVKMEQRWLFNKLHSGLPRFALQTVDPDCQRASLWSHVARLLLTTVCMGFTCKHTLSSCFVW